MKPTLLSLLAIIFVLSATAQHPQIEWQKTIGGSDNDYLYSIQQTADGGYILGGAAHSGASGEKTEASQGGIDYWVIKLNAAGNIVWQNTIGGNSVDLLYSIQQTADGGYILGGYSNSGISGDKTEASHGGYDCWVLKLDAAGNIVWQNTIGGSAADELFSMQQTADGGFILGSISDSGISGDKTEGSHGASDFWVIKLDAAGNIIWQNTIGGSGYDYLYSTQQTADGGYILGGHSNSGISGDKTEAAQGPDYWVVRLDSAGDIAWENTIHASGIDGINSLRQTADGGYIVGGTSDSGISGDKTESRRGDYDYWVIKLDAAGNIAWQNTIGGSGRDDLSSVEQTADGGYIVGGYSDSGISGDKTEAARGLEDYWILKLDAAGNIVWQKTIGGNAEDDLNAVRQTADGGYILVGTSETGISGDKTEASRGGNDYWIVKLTSDLFTISGQLLTEAGSPVSGATITLSGPNGLTDIDITDTTGGYGFTTALSGTYTLTPSKSNDVVVNNGITTVDVLLMRRHILGNALLDSPYKIIAAAKLNAEGDTTVTTNDVLLARSMILGNSTSFPTNRLWQFVPSDHVFPDNYHPFPFPTSRTYTNITTNQTNQNFIGIKLGDVNGS